MGFGEGAVPLVGGTRTDAGGLLCRESPGPSPPRLLADSSAGKMLLHIRNAERFEQQDVTVRTFIPHCWSPVFCRLGGGRVLALG